MDVEGGIERKVLECTGKGVEGGGWGEQNLGWIEKIYINGWKNYLWKLGKMKTVYSKKVAIY